MMQNDFFKGLLSHKHNQADNLSPNPQNTSFKVRVANTDPAPVVTSYLGYLYNYYAAGNVLNIAAAGWHLPTTAEWSTLSQFLGDIPYGLEVSGGKLREAGTAHWYAPNTGATNSSGFTALPSGNRQNGVFSWAKSAAMFWTATETPQVPPQVFIKLLYDNSDSGFTGGSNTVKTEGVSIRLIKDATVLIDGQTGTYTGNDGTIYPTICIGTQEWLSVNLAETKYRDGSSIPTVEDKTAWLALATGARCAFNNDPANAVTAVTEGGTLYNEAVINPQDVIEFETGTNVELSLTGKKINISSPLITPLTYAELKALADAGHLEPGRVYKITDYETTYIQPVTLIQTTTGIVEQLLVTAISASVLNHISSSLLYPQDIVYYDINDSTEGFTKGKIYRRIETIKNIDVAGDWRHILYRRWKLNVTTQWVSGNNYVKGDVVVNNDFIYIAPYDIVNSLDVNELIRFSFKNGTYTGHASTGHIICVGVDEFHPNGVIPVLSDDYQDLLLFPSYATSNKIWDILIRPSINYANGTSEVCLNIVIRGTVLTIIKITESRHITIGDPTSASTRFELQGGKFSTFGRINQTIILPLHIYLTVGSINRSYIGSQCGGLLMGDYATQQNTNGQELQCINIENYSSGWIIGNGVQAANISNQSKFGTIGSNCKSINVGSYTNYLILKANNTNWNIGSQLELAAKTIPVISNDYTKEVYKAGAKVLCEYTDEFADVNISEL